jgi:hypothetical protein
VMRNAHVQIIIVLCHLISKTWGRVQLVLL